MYDIEGVPDGLRITRIIDLTHIEMGWLVEFEPAVPVPAGMRLLDFRPPVGGDDFLFPDGTVGHVYGNLAWPISDTPRWIVERDITTREIVITADNRILDRGEHR